MSRFQEYIQWQTVAGEVVQVGESRITPLASVLAVRLPGGNVSGSFVWNRPVAVLVEQNGRTERIPIIDVTRLAQLGLLAAAVLTGLMARSVRRGKVKSRVVKSQ